jgi:hypothetical protein
MQMALAIGGNRAENIWKAPTRRDSGIPARRCRRLRLIRQVGGEVDDVEYSSAQRRREEKAREEDHEEDRDNTPRDDYDEGHHHHDSNDCDDHDDDAADDSRLELHTWI